MGYYNPSGLIEIDDSLIESIEKALQMDKIARRSSISSRKGLLPPWSLELDIIITNTNERMRLALWLDKTGKTTIELTSVNDVCRQGHFDRTEAHKNPNTFIIPPPHHIHFPTKKYPNLRNRPAYAYAVNKGNDYVEALQILCDHTNIRIDGIPLPLLRI